MIFDTHAHYDQVQFDDDRDLLLRQMQDHGIGRIVNIGCDLEASRRSHLGGSRCSSIGCRHKTRPCAG